MLRTKRHVADVTISYIMALVKFLYINHPYYDDHRHGWRKYSGLNKIIIICMFRWNVSQSQTSECCGHNAQKWTSFWCMAEKSENIIKCKSVSVLLISDGQLWYIEHTNVQNRYQYAKLIVYEDDVADITDVNKNMSSRVFIISI